MDFCVFNVIVSRCEQTKICAVVKFEKIWSMGILFSSKISIDAMFSAFFLYSVFDLACTSQLMQSQLEVFTILILSNL